MTKLEVIRELVNHDHRFLSPSCAKAFCKPFGIKPNLYMATDTRSRFKGLTLSGINPKTKKEYQEGDEAPGVASHHLACQIASHLKVDYPEMFGVGSQLRSACGAIEKFLLEN